MIIKRFVLRKSKCHFKSFTEIACSYQLSHLSIYRTDGPRCLLLNIQCAMKALKSFVRLFLPSDSNPSFSVPASGHSHS